MENGLNRRVWFFIGMNVDDLSSSIVCDNFKWIFDIIKMEEF